MTKWTYRVFKFKPTGTFLRGGNVDDQWLEGELNKLGQDGWEIAGIFTSAIAQGATNEVAVVLKRSL